MRGNRELVTQALANLVDNAIKYAGPSARRPTARRPRSWSRRGADGDRIRLSVSDHGPGIPEADRGRVVERFVRLEQSRSEPGSGLGLSLASAVAHLHGGELRLEDNAPGLKATLVLPRGGPQLPQPSRIVNRAAERRLSTGGMARPAGEETAKPRAKQTTSDARRSRVSRRAAADATARRRRPASPNGWPRSAAAPPARRSSA